MEMVIFSYFQPEIENTLEYVGSNLGYIDTFVEYIKTALGLLGKYWGMKGILKYSQYTLKYS